MADNEGRSGGSPAGMRQAPQRGPGPWRRAWPRTLHGAEGEAQARQGHARQALGIHARPQGRARRGGGLRRRGGRRSASSAPFLIGRGIDAMVGGQGAVDFGKLGSIIALLVASYLAGTLFSWLQIYIMAGVAQDTVRDIRRDLFAKIQTLLAPLLRRAHPRRDHEPAHERRGEREHHSHAERGPSSSRARSPWSARSP